MVKYCVAKAALSSASVGRCVGATFGCPRAPGMRWGAAGVKKGGGPDGPPLECPEAGAVLEVDLQIREHEPSQGVVDLWIRIAVEEWRRQAPGRQDRRILVHHVVDADLQGDVAQDLVAGDQIEVVTGSRVLDGGAEHAREERRGVRELDLGIADVAPPRLQSDAVPWGHPAGRKRVPPLRQRVATGRTEIACAVVITRARIRLDVQRGGVRPYQIEAQCAQGAERLRVIERYVDAALLLESEIGQWIIDIAEGREPDRARRIAMHHGAELRVVVEHALLDDQVRAVARYQILDLDVEDVERRAERGQEGWRRHDAERVGIGDLRLQVRIAARPAVVLAGRVGGRAEDSVLRGGKPAARALGGRRRGPGAGGRTGARIDRAVQADDI